MKAGKMTHWVGAALVWGLCSTPAFAVTGDAVLGLTARSTAGATGDRKEADALLKQARQAMAGGDFRKAEELIARAEALGVKYSKIEAKTTDTPDTVRRDLAKAKAAANPAGPQDVAERMVDSTKSKAQAALEQGRKALRQGNMPEAIVCWQRAAGSKATFERGEYGPDALARELVAQGVDLSKVRPLGAAPAPLELDPRDLGAADVDPIPGVERTTAEPGRAFGEPASPDSAPQDRHPLTREKGAVALRAIKSEAMKLVAQAKLLAARGEMDAAMELCDQAEELNVPDAAFAPNETRPFETIAEIRRLASRRDGVRPASAVGEPGGVSPSVYSSGEDASYVAPVKAEGPFADDKDQTGVAERLVREGEAALAEGDRKTALEKFSQAWRRESELDPRTRQNVKDKLSYLRGHRDATAPDGTLEKVDQIQSAAYQKMLKEVAAERQEVEKLANDSPKAALTRLNELRERVSQSDVDAAGKKHLLTICDRSIRELETYITQYKGDIELREQNQKVEADLARDREVRAETQRKLADLVEKFNRLMDERRWPEAQALAKQALELAPNSTIAEQLKWKSEFAMRNARYDDIQNRKANGFTDVMDSVEESGIPFDDRLPIQYPGLDRWEKLSKNRKGFNEPRRMSEAEKEIEKALQMPIDATFDNRRLGDVLAYVSDVADINVVIDEVALRGEAVQTDFPVTLKLNKPISLKSFLTLVLSPLRLTYVVQNDVLRITTEASKGSAAYPQTYYVADLVMPIPNFNPSYNMGMPAALRDSLQAASFAANAASGRTMPLTVRPEDLVNAPTTTGLQSAAKNQEILAQMGAVDRLQSLSSVQNSRPGPNYGPGGMGGAAMADFDTLMTLIQETIAPDTWEENGGTGRMSPFPLNLSLIVSQTQEVHQQLADLLAQLRRLQDLQVTIEVRFITLNDNFFERMGIDFDFSINTDTPYSTAGTALNPVTNIPNFQTNPNNTGGFNTSRSTVIGWADRNQRTGIPTLDLNIPFTQNTFTTAVPQFGGFNAANAAQFGFAILSDIELFFILQAASGDRRSNVLQAPKVTLYNGQSAFVNDTSARPFITQIIPVVGDFAAAHQPVVTVLNEGTTLSVQAVVSPDRKYCRLTLVPMFSQVGDVSTFTFAGSVTTNSGTTVADPSDAKKTVVNGQTITQSGTTVQLPTFISTSVSTTVSVPDGGTVLLGGIKRLNEGRNEFGVPFLQHIPYVQRLFRNTSIGRTTQSLMMMVTPRIIIQEEEEENLGLRPMGSN